MATMTGAYIRARWPDVFAAAPTPPAIDPLDEAIVAAQNQLDQEGWGVNYSEAVVLLAADMATLGTGQRAGGVVRAQAGQVSLQYGSTASGEAATSFRALYDALLSRQAQFRMTLPGE